jgi:outer membrane immunogenic protein
MRLSFEPSVVLAVLLAATAAAPARAADLPYEPIAVEGFSWTGVYVGGAIGYAFSDLDVRNRRQGDPFRYTDKVDSILGSAYIGANYQIGSIVVGAEADVTLGDFGGKTRGCGGAGAFAFKCKANADDVFGTIRGRIGYAFDRFLVFGTGGLAIAGDVDFRRDSPFGGAFDFQKKSSGTRYGYAVGGGVEYAVTDNVIVRGEYQYVDFGSEKFTARSDIGGTQPVQIDQDAHIIRAGVAYKF